MNEPKYLTYYELNEIFQDIYTTGWPAPKLSEEDEKFAVLIQQASMRKNGLILPAINND